MTAALRRRIAQQLARAAKETGRDADRGFALAGGAQAIDELANHREDLGSGRSIGRTLVAGALGSVGGATAGRAIRTGVSGAKAASRLIRRTGNANPISSVRRAGSGLMPKGGSKRMAKVAERRAREMDRGVEDLRRDMRANPRMQEGKGAERYERQRDHLAGQAAKDRQTARQLRARMPLKDGERRRAFKAFGNAEPQSAISKREPEFKVRSKGGGDPVEATRATSAGSVKTGGGAILHYKPGDMIVTYGPGDQAVVRGDIFRDTYRKVGEGRYVKRGGVRMRASVARQGRTVRTLEGTAYADAGDVVVRGTRGERWPVKADKFSRKYDVEF